MVASIGIILAVIVGLAVCLRFVNRLPRHKPMTPEEPIVAGESQFAAAVEKACRRHSGKTGLHLLTTGLSAFAARVALIRLARRGIDAQYYIWNNDLSGRMLLAELLAAADRGVRVRILIDDNPTKGLDPMWAGMARHDNVAVRIFNPLTIRRFRPANYLFDFFRLNRRMHNKSLTVDAAATIVGGRNIGDEYFGAKDKGLFIDVDTIAIGAVVPQVAAAFEHYWTSEPVYPAEAILPDKYALSLADLRSPRFPKSDLAKAYRSAAEQEVAALDFGNRTEKLDWAEVELVVDDPVKGLRELAPGKLIASRIVSELEQATNHVDLVSGYFVPGRRGARLLEKLARRGVEVRVATNGVQVTDVPVVHAGYAPYRRRLLRAGAQLFEVRPLDDGRDSAKALGQTRFSGGGESVHAKTFGIDDRLFFIGSFNLDPRSVLLNCEMGFLVAAPQLALGLGKVLDDRLPDVAYRLSMDEKDRIRWIVADLSTQIIHKKEPGTGSCTRLLLRVLGLLPIEWLL